MRHAFLFPQASQLRGGFALHSVAKIDDFVTIKKTNNPNPSPPRRQVRIIFFGMSGDTELFENPSNIKDLWASEQKIILYIPLF